MNVTTRLVLAFLLVSLMPLAAVGYVGLRAMERANSLAVEESTEVLKELGETAIHQKALGVARQVALYLEAHPELLDLSPDALAGDETLASLAVQSVGETGYTAVYDSRGLVYFHANPEIVGQNMGDLAATLPAFWDVFEASLDGSAAAGYYEWEDADGTVRDKYMSCVPVGGTDLRVAATTYIDEFYRPIRATEQKIVAISRESRRYLTATLVVVGFGALGAALWLAWGISRPVQRLILAAGDLERGQYRSQGLAAELSRRDDLGRLARVFDRMAREVQAREERLHRQIDRLRIEIDEAKRARQVARITETDYFQDLRKRAKRMRNRAEE